MPQREIMRRSRIIGQKHNSTKLRGYCWCDGCNRMFDRISESHCV